MSIFSRIKNAISGEWSRISDDVTQAAERANGRLGEVAAEAMNRARGHDAADRAALADLGRLSQLEPGLGEAAARYVLGESEDETVLAALKAKGQAAADALDVGTSAYTYGKKAEAKQARRNAIGLGDPFDAPMIARYMRLLAATAALDDTWPGTAATHPSLRIYMREVSNAEWSARRAHERFIGENGDVARGRLVALADAMGAGEDDLLDVLYGYSDDYSHSSARSLATLLGRGRLLAACLDRAEALMARVPASGRAAIVKHLGTLGDDPRARAVVLGALGDGAKAVRAAADKASAGFDDAVLREAGVAGLATGTVASRDAAASMLARLVAKGDAGAREALEARLPDEKTARVRRTIEAALAGADTRAGGEAGDDARSYVAIDGSRVAIPPVEMPPVEPLPQPTETDRERLREAIRAEGLGRGRRRGSRGGPDPSFADWFFDHITSDDLQLAAELTREKGSGSVVDELEWTMSFAEPRRVAEEFVARLPLRRRLELAVALRLARGQPLAGASGFHGSRVDMGVGDWLQTPDGDIRVLENLALTSGVRNVRTRDYRGLTLPVVPGYSMRGLWGYWALHSGLDIADEALWPYLATNLQVLDGPMGLAPAPEESFERMQVLNLLGVMPAVPRRYLQPLLDIAVARRGPLATRATALLEGAGDLEPQLVGMLDDGRQDYRAGAARMLGTHGGDAAGAALWARLKTEKSEVARAAILSALSRLGEDLSSVLSPQALLEEARAGLGKLKGDKLDWLLAEAMPQLTLSDGSVLDPEVVRWWLALADKLKQPGGNALFDLWLDLLDPPSRDRLGLFVLDAFIGRDTTRMPFAEADERARAQVSAYYKTKAGSPEHERHVAATRQHLLGQYMSSAAAHKGLLGLAVRADPARLASRAKPYLKENGQRTNQAKAVLDMLAGAGEPATLQVVIATHARFKQKGVQAHAGQLIEEAAERRGWTRDELADRTVPTGGFDEEGRLALPIGEEEKPYEARLASDCSVRLVSPDGKTIKSLPSGKDETTRASKKALTAAKKEIKEIARLQSERLYEAMCAGREWAPGDWSRAFREHPVMRRLGERVVWLADTQAPGSGDTGSGDTGSGERHGEAGGGEAGAALAFRPTPEGTLTNVEDEDVALEGFGRVRIAHSALLGAEGREAWRAHFADYEVVPLIDQFERPLLGVPRNEIDPKRHAKRTGRDAPWGEDTRAGELVVEREGWLSDNYAVRSAAEKRGWQRGSVEDAGWYMEYVKHFPAARLVAVLSFTGSAVGLDDQHGAAVTTLSFHRSDGRYWRPQPLDLRAVPPILLSECRNDYREVAETGAFDPEWEKKGGY